MIGTELGLIAKLLPFCYLLLIRKNNSLKATRKQKAYDEEASSEDHGLHLHVQVQREVDVIVVRLAHGRHQAVPLPDDAAGLGDAVDGSDLGDEKGLW